MEIQLSKKDTGLRYTTKTTWNSSDSEYLDGTVRLTITKDFHYLHPSEDCEVVLREGACMDLYVVQGRNSTGELWWYVDGLSVSSTGVYTDECIGWNNCAAAVGDDKDKSLHDLIRYTISILLMHAVNYDDNDSAIYRIEVAETHYGYFGIEYLKHAVNREEVCA